jgi:hypothetical protein
VADGVAFEVERFEWIDKHRLEVSGRWYGLRGHRFVRPALTVEVDDGDDPRRMLADLEHKPWAADDGTDWIAAFPWDGDPVELARAELAVAPTLAVDLPLPRLPGSRKRRTSTTAPARRPPAAPAEAQAAPTHERDAPAREREAPARERDEASRKSDSLARERDEAIAERDALIHERDEAIAERDSLIADRTEAVAQRDAAISERDSLIADRAQAIAQRDAAVSERDSLARERDAAVRARAAAVAERDDARRALAAAISARDRADEARSALARERDAARTARQHDLEALDEPGDRELPPAAPRPLPEQSALALWGQRLTAIVALGVLAFVVYTLLERVV